MTDAYCRLPIPDCRFPIADSRLPIPDCRFPIPDWLSSSLFPIVDLIRQIGKPGIIIGIIPLFC
jgi:hypothetical protein